jgi:aminomethyltransferase
VDFTKPLFNGRAALLKEQANGSRYRFAMLDVEGNKPAEHSFILKGDKQVGTVTSAAWCPTAKANIAYAQIEMPHGAVGDELVAEIYYQRELHWTRLLAPCKVIDAPIFKSPKRWQTPAPPH